MTFSSISTESSSNRPLVSQPSNHERLGNNGQPETDKAVPANQQGVMSSLGEHTACQPSAPHTSLLPTYAQAQLSPEHMGDQGAHTQLPSAGIANGQTNASLLVQLRDGRFLEQLLLHPESIPHSDQRALRQQLQQRLSSGGASQSFTEAVPRAEAHQLLTVPLSDADGAPIINLQLQQQLERKQAAMVENGKRPLSTPVTVDNVKDNISQKPAITSSALVQLLLAVERGSEIDQHGLQQVARQLLAKNDTSAPLASHQALVLAALLLEADDEHAPANSKMSPRLRRQLAHHLLPLLQRQADAEIESISHQKRQQTSLGEDKQPQRSARQVTNAGTRAVDYFAAHDQQLPLATSLLWPVLATAPTSISESQINPLLGALVDKGALPVGNNHSLSQFVGRASMEQLMMVLTTLVMKVNTQSAQALFASQKSTQSATEAITAQQLQKQIEEADKALEQQESARKAGIFSTIFSWVAAAITTVAAVVTMNPVLMAAAVLLITSAAIDSAVLAMGDKAPECLQWISTGLSVAAGLLSGGATLLTNLGKVAIKEGMKAALKVVFKAMSNACKKLIQWIKNIPNATKELTSKGFEILKHPKEAVVSAATKAKNRVTHAFKDPENKAELVKNVALGAGNVASAVDQGVASYYNYRGGMIQAALQTLQNDNWFLQMILEYYQKQKNQLHQTMSDLYQQQGESVGIASQALQDSTTLQGRIAGSLI